MNMTIIKEYIILQKWMPTKCGGDLVWVLGLNDQTSEVLKGPWSDEKFL